MAEWLRDDPLFRAELDRASATAFDASLSQMQSAAGEAVERLRELVAGKDRRVALEAAKEILSGAFDADLALTARRAGIGRMLGDEAG